MPKDVGVLTTDNFIQFFAKYDANSDNFLDKDELQTMREEHKQANSTLSKEHQTEIKSLFTKKYLQDGFGVDLDELYEIAEEIDKIRQEVKEGKADSQTATSLPKEIGKDASQFELA